MINRRQEWRFLLLYWTGMRIGELLALTYDDINLEEKTISITKSYQRLKRKRCDNTAENTEKYPDINHPDSWRMSSESIAAICTEL